MADDHQLFGELTAEQYRALIEQTSDVITVVAADGTIQYQSPNCENVKGWSQEEMLGENILEYVHPEDRQYVMEQFETLREEAGVIDDEVEFRFRTNDDEWVWLAVTGTSAGSTGPIEGYITTSRDITEQKNFEERLLEQRNDLETLNEVLRHDIRNDLQLIGAYADLLEEHVDAEGEEYLKTIKQSTDNAVALTATAKDLAAVMLRSDREDVTQPLTRRLTEELDSVRSSHPDAEVTVEGSLPEVSVRGDELLGSVFGNLLENAIQHNDTDAPTVTVSASADDERIRVRVADNGPGIPDERKEDIFGKGNKGLESAGTGIGLYLVRSLVESYGGDIWVEDNEPSGAVFVVELQRAT
ncbi:MAG: PAS domain-containing sensor histidine kinase [Natronomonas sp.]